MGSTSVLKEGVGGTGGVGLVGGGGFLLMHA